MLEPWDRLAWCQRLIAARPDFYALREATMLELRALGASDREIAQACRLTRQRVYQATAPDEDECRREGFPNMEPEEFAVWWAESHGHRWSTQNEFMAIKCRRIAWRYLDAPPFPDPGRS